MTARETVLQSGLLELVFFWHEDRFAHRVQAARTESIDQPAVPAEQFLVSVEGTSADAWPASPPFQHLHPVEHAGGERGALLLGMAGMSHWSASVTAHPRDSRFVFDVACRLQELPQFLGTTYRLNEGESAARGVALRLQTETLPGQVARVQRSGSDIWQLGVEQPSEPCPCTIRWRYSISA